MTSRCGSLLLSASADARSSDDVIAFEGCLRRRVCSNLWVCRHRRRECQPDKPHHADAEQCRSSSQHEQWGPACAQGTWSIGGSWRVWLAPRRATVARDIVCSQAMPNKVIHAVEYHVRACACACACAYACACVRVDADVVICRRSGTFQTFSTKCTLSDLLLCRLFKDCTAH